MLPKAAMAPELDHGLFEDIRSDMLRFAQLQLRDHAMAEDVVQESMMAAIQGKKSFEQRASAKTWVFSILRHKIVDAIRLKTRTINVGALSPAETEMDATFDTLFYPNQHWRSEERPSDWGDPVKALHQEQFWAIFEACLNHLPENTARVFMMREFLEFETEEVCRELKLSMSNCHVILHRARNSLRRCLEKSGFMP
jgi:RNA polymerase sigma-70 factor (ECF subfamily)